MPNRPLPTQEVTLQLTLEEINTLLESLGQMPYIKVYTLISKIQEQASQQISANADGQKSE